MFHEFPGMTNVEKIVCITSLYPCITINGIQKLLDMNGIALADATLRSCIARAQTKKLIKSDHLAKDPELVTDKRHPNHNLKMYYATQSGIKYMADSIVNPADRWCCSKVANLSNMRMNSPDFRRRKAQQTEIAINNYIEGDVSILYAYCTLYFLFKEKATGNQLVNESESFFVSKYILESFSGKRSNFAYRGLRLQVHPKAISFDVVVELEPNQISYMNSAMITYIRNILLRAVRKYDDDSIGQYIGINENYGVIVCFDFLKKNQMKKAISNLFDDNPIKMTTQRYWRESERRNALRYNSSLLSEEKKTGPTIDAILRDPSIACKLCIGNYYIKELIGYNYKNYEPYFIKTKFSNNIELDNLVNNYRRT